MENSTIVFPVLFFEWKSISNIYYDTNMAVNQSDDYILCLYWIKYLSWYEIKSWYEIVYGQMVIAQHQPHPLSTNKQSTSY